MGIVGWNLVCAGICHIGRLKINAKPQSREGAKSDFSSCFASLRLSVKSVTVIGKVATLARALKAMVAGIGRLNA